ncbi:Lrp/AsnC family transcriptional regulator [Arthrobacter wenxiniae]|jgi:Lrp/AsnC family transcriptional regulator for asnA, asnC and gidA|uniref:Lrp/AsnC family transcriptional regulator n=1 Tax=Arthrobacter wenxiniae TaxID=2713570 RepID=A0A7Y7IFJ7_9MICC|nr:Lrp/AsnC family transcriptional regulator [Arthrobacter wenxiniae]NVM94065.1 Lrp/AsnC family transcriptional regulator [Arthrobacter wenxiniae]
MKVDRLDAAIIEMYTEEPGVGVLECSRRLRVARATVQGRLDRLHAGGVITGIVPQLSPAAFGFPIIAFCSIEIAQGIGHGAVFAAIGEIPEILEMHTVSGASDLLVKIVARSTTDLQRVLDALSQAPGVARTSSVIALETHIENRHLPLLKAAAETGPPLL